MIEEFRTASSLLSAALERYLAACSALANCYDPCNPLQGISPVISDLIPKELESTHLYGTKLRQATEILSQTRNIAPAITPVNILPPDILARIFQLVLEPQPEYSERKRDEQPFYLRYPDALSYVCSRWRRIAISSRTLGTRIDVGSQNNISSGALLARAELLASRADPSSLDLHIGQSDIISPDFEILLNAFCASIAPRVKSVNLSTDYLGVPFKLRQSFFTNCTPGTLNELSINGGEELCYEVASETPTTSRS